MQVSANAIDLLKTHEQFAKKYGHPARIARKSFGLPIVMMAHSTIGRLGAPIEDLPGIRRCLVYMAGRVHWRDHLWLIPLSKREPFKRGPFGDYWESEKLSLLADSLLLTMLAYQQSLWEFHTNLAPIVIGDVVNGFELVCDWIDRGVPVDPARNEVVVRIRGDMIDRSLTISTPNVGR